MTLAEIYIIIIIINNIYWKLYVLIKYRKVFDLFMKICITRKEIKNKNNEERV